MNVSYFKSEVKLAFSWFNGDYKVSNGEQVIF